jgi:hypothetical protein
MMVFEGVITALASVGIFELYLPFLLLFAIFFAILEKTKIFGEKSRINILLSFIISLYVVAFSPISGTIGLWFANLFAATGAVLISIIIFFLVVGLMVAPWWSDVAKAKGWKWLIPLGIIIAFLIVLGSTFGGVTGVSGTVTIPGLSSQDLLFLTLVIMTVIIVWWMTRGEKSQTKGQWFLQPE